MSQIKRISERFFCQSGLFKCFQNTTFGIDQTFSLKLKNQLYGKWNNQIIQNSITVYWSYVASGSNSLK
jgi:hypothetical protein